jgi:hypothetical protein
MPHIPLHGWKERDRKAEEKENKRKGRPIQKPPRKKKRKSRAVLDAEGPADVERTMGLDQWLSENRRLEEAPPVSAGERLKGTPPRSDQALRAFREYRGRTEAEREMRRPNKEGGRVRGYSSGKRVKASGKVRGAGMAKKGVRKAKMVKMKG